MTASNNGRIDMVFKPKYPARIMVTIYLYPLGILLFIFFIYMTMTSGRFLPYGLIAMVFGFTLSSMPMILFREIQFIDEGIRLKRYYFPSRMIRYDDLVALTPRGIVAKRGGIPLVNVINRKDLEKMIHKLKSQGKIKFEHKD